MRALVSWLREFVDVPVDAGTLAKTLEMRGFEVAAIEPAPAGSDPSDRVIDFEITANRPDCLGLLALAREAAAAFDAPVRPDPPFPAAPRHAGDPHPDLDPAFTVVLEDAELCPRYAAAGAVVEVGPSPDWLARRLEAAGVRPINNVVDATNYVMLEMGHPMHAFDLERLAGREIRVRRARPGERLRTLDGQERTLSEETLVIADAERAHAIGGVMGGADSEVTATTRLIALEAAYFNPPSVRRTSRRLGVKTEASSRFERGANIGAPVAALERARALLHAIGAGVGRGPLIDRYPAPREARVLTLRAARIEHVLGMSVSPDAVVRILERLGFVIAKRGQDATQRPVWHVTVPPQRVDVTREVDLIEEAARHDGYDRLPATFPELLQVAPAPDPRIARERLVRQVLQGAGCTEAVTFSFIPRDAAAPFAAADLLELANPLTETMAVMRPSLVPGLVDVVSHNRRRQQDSVRVFEVGSRFSAGRGERRAAAFVITGSASEEHWSGKARAVDFFDAKGIVEGLLHAFGISDARFDAAEYEPLEPGRSARITVDADGSALQVGTCGQLRAAIVAAHDLPVRDEVYVAEIDVDAIAALTARQDRLVARALPRFPSVVRDVSLLVPDALPAADVRGTIWAAAPDTLQRLREFDRYRGTGVPEGSVSLSFRLTFRASDRTLTDAEVQAAMDHIIRAVTEGHGAQQR